ncbi:hypothetical protein VXS72_10970 [Acinetobacter pittii]|uniref:hypothetical protein n=1 Tax=Acinetobacter pittii TaxID=48296 RepID=UPI002E181813|nr:hypothetical protein [Acinetobacter pittii]
MSLEVLLTEKNIVKALIVDDVYDSIPKASEINALQSDWPTFSDDITDEQKEKIFSIYPASRDLDFDTCINDDKYVAAIWQLKDELGDLVTPIFETYISNQENDLRYVKIIKEKLSALGMNVEESGRNFTDKIKDIDLLIIDLFLDSAQNYTNLDEFNHILKDALDSRKTNPPLVILMSRSSRLESKRIEFRDKVGLLDSAFRIIKKQDLQEHNVFEITLERLVQNQPNSQILANLFCALENGINKAAENSLLLLRKLRLSDVGQIQNLLLNAEGQPIGSYLVDIFDKVLSHEIEQDDGIIDAALQVNKLSFDKYPSPYISGSADLQELVYRILTQNKNRLKLPSSLEGSKVSFGDLLALSDNVSTDEVKQKILVDLEPNNILLVLTPACDLQRGAAPRVLCLVGTTKPLKASDWSYKDDAKTAAILIKDEIHGIQWDLKHIDTLSQKLLTDALENHLMSIVGRLRESHALELQQRVLAGLGRVGQMAALPATFPVRLKIFYPDLEKKLKELGSAFYEAVCFVGRNKNSHQEIRLVLTESSIDNIINQIHSLNEKEIFGNARNNFRILKESEVLRQSLESGINLKKVIDHQTWKNFELDSKPVGLISWNNQAKSGDDTTSNGIIFLIQDIDLPDAPGLEDVRANLIN